MSSLRGLKPGRGKRRASPERIEKWLEDVSALMVAGKYAGAVRACQRVLRYVEPSTRQHGEALSYLGTAYSILQRFTEAYDAYAEALMIIQDDPYLWYNRGFASRFTMRMGQSVRDFERALELEDKGGSTKTN